MTTSLTTRGSVDTDHLTIGLQRFDPGLAVGSITAEMAAGDGQLWFAVSDGDTANQQALTAFTAIRVMGAKISMDLLVELARVGSADTYAADAVLTDADCHILINQPGSVDLYEKYHSR